MAARSAEAECQLPILSILIIIGYLGFYIIWTDFAGQAYESFSLRLIAGAIGLLLLFHKHWPQRLKTIFPAFWYLSLIYLFPFFFVFMLAKNNSSSIWQLNFLIAITLLVILVDWLSATILIIVGALLGGLAYYYTTPDAYFPLKTIEILASFCLSIIAFGGFFIHNKNRFQHERILAINNFTDMIAHEMRTPLISINMTGANLKRWIPSLVESYELAVAHELKVPHIDKRVLTRLPSNAASIQIESAQAQQIINMLLTNVEARKILQIKLETHDVIDMANQALERYAFDFSDRALIELEPHNSFKIKANEAFINVIFNLIKNALHHIKAAGKGKISIWAIESGAYNELHFKDTGTGLSKRKLAQLFKPFVTDTQHGTGLGLAFCKIVMESYGGSIRCESVEGEYAEFILNFPKLRKTWSFIPALIVFAHIRDVTDWKPQGFSKEVAELTQLEQQVEVLLNSLQYLRYENSSLKQKLKQSTQQQTELEAKNKQAVQQIRKLINQLKEEVKWLTWKTSLK